MTFPTPITFFIRHYACTVAYKSTVMCCFDTNNSDVHINDVRRSYSWKLRTLVSVRLTQCCSQISSGTFTFTQYLRAEFCHKWYECL